MKLSEIVGAATGLAVYAEIGLVLFLVAFTVVLVQVLSKANQGEFRTAKTLPLESDDGTTIAVKGDGT